MIYPEGFTGKSEKKGIFGGSVGLQYPFKQAVPKGHGGRSTPHLPSGTLVSQLVNPSDRRTALSQSTSKNATMTNMIPAVISGFILL